MANVLNSLPSGASPAKTLLAGVPADLTAR